MGERAGGDHDGGRRLEDCTGSMRQTSSAEASLDSYIDSRVLPQDFGAPKNIRGHILPDSCKSKHGCMVIKLVCVRGRRRGPEENTAGGRAGGIGHHITNNDTTYVEGSGCHSRPRPIVMKTSAHTHNHARNQPRTNARTFMRM